MKNPLTIAVLAMAAALAADAQTVTVTNPTAATTWIKGSPATITWTKQGVQPVIVRITLTDAAETTTVALIADNVPNNGSYQWPAVPTTIADGSYKVKVRAYYEEITGTSPAFTIAAQSGGQHTGGAHLAARTPLAMKKPTANVPPGIPKAVVITYPGSMVEWELAHPYTIRWTAGTVPDDGFEVDLYTAAGTKVTSLLSGGAKSVGPYSWSFEFKPWCNLSPGDYRIRIKSWLSGSTATSGPIKMLVRTKKRTENIAVQVENVDLFYGTTAALIDCSRQIPPGKARVGYDYSTYQNNSSYHAFRARLTFDLSRFDGRKIEVESATLITGDMQGCPGNQHPFCGAKLFMLGAGEVTRWKTFQATAVPYQLTGWWAPYNPAGFDITAAVREWVNKTKPNHGLVMGSGNDGFSAPEGHALVCVSFFKPIMYVTFTETPDPCAAP